MPAFWCVGEVARLWLIHEGWEIKGKRAYKDGRVDIPAPVDGRPYDLHDVACEEETSGSETLRRIHKWVAGESTDRRILRCESCKEPATDERPVILWWFVAEVKNRSKPIVVKIRLQHDEDRCCNMPEERSYDTSPLVYASSLRERVPDILQSYELSPSDVEWLRGVAGY